MTADTPSNSLATSPATRLVWSVAPSCHAPATPATKLHGRRVLVLGGDPTTAAGVTTELVRHGYVVRSIDAGAAADVALEAVREAGRIDAIVDLNLSAPFSLETTAAWEAPLLQSVRVLQACYGGWLDESNAERLGYVVVTRMGGHMGYRQGGCLQPLGGLWAGLAKTLPQELPNCNVKILDLSEGDYANAGEILARELYDWGLFEVGWIDGVRQTLSGRCEPPEVTLPDFSDRDTVLLSGGARGIGFKLASYLASERGCRVILTGRTAAPDPTACYASLDDEEFRRYEWEELRRAAQTRQIAVTRRRLNRERTARELAQNLREVSDRRLRIEYRQCDVTSAADVTALVRSLGSSLTVVVHNAGVDHPVRLPSKTSEAILQTIRTKVNGFVNLIQAVQGVPLRMFCNVGSLTGRWGGMTGETDYAAANECLTRLGMWAADRFGFPVKSICWPTWDRVGMIKNFAVTGAYMSPLDVNEGLTHWHRELRCPAPAEVTYVGNVGPALTPIQLKGFPGVPGMPTIDALYSRLHYLGRVVTFRPFQQMLSDCEVNAAVAPLVSDFRVGGQPAMPVSALLEYAVAGADWIQPAGRTRMHLHEIRDVECWLRRLCVPEGKYVFSRDVKGSGTEREWSVEISIARQGERVLRAELVYCADHPREGARSLVPRGGPGRLQDRSDLHWRGVVFEAGQWTFVDDRAWMTSVHPCSPFDAWATVAVPDNQLPAAHLENTIRAAASLEQSSGTPDRLHIGAMRLYASGEARHVIGGIEPGTWRILDDEGRTRVEVDGLAFRGAAAPMKDSSYGYSTPAR